jgi:predicted transcriptional regulator
LPKSEIPDRLREGWAYDEVAREEGLTERRIRQIVAARFARPLALRAAPT